MTNEDIDICVKIYYHAFKMWQVWEKINSKAIDWDFESHNEYFRKCINEKGRYAYCCKLEGEVIGYITAWDTPSVSDEKSIYIDMVAITPEMQKKGHGRKMLEDFLETVVKDNYVSLVTERELPAYKMYLDMGFVDEKNVRMHRSLKENELLNEMKKFTAEIRETLEKEVKDKEAKEKILELLDKIGEK